MPLVSIVARSRLFLSQTQRSKSLAIQTSASDLALIAKEDSVPNERLPWPFQIPTMPPHHQYQAANVSTRADRSLMINHPCVRDIVFGTFRADDRSEE
jgi:hypothetical protein